MGVSPVWSCSPHATCGTAPLKICPRSWKSRSGATRGSNVVDWYPRADSWRHLSDPAAKVFIVTEAGDPLHYERYLTSLEWTPAHPGEYLEKIRITSDPDREETLGLLALTVLPAD